MNQALRVTLTVAAVVAITFAGYRVLRDQTDPDPPPAPEAAAARFRDIDADGAARLRWTTETERGVQNDLVVIIADDLEVRLEGSLTRYRVDDSAYLCYPTGDGPVCEADRNPSPLVPTAGTLTFAAEDAVPLTIAGRSASCWTFESGAVTTRSCADDDTGVAVLTETTDGDTGSSYRQTLVEWGPASPADVAVPPELAAVIE